MYKNCEKEWNASINCTSTACVADLAKWTTPDATKTLKCATDNKYNISNSTTYGTECDYYLCMKGSAWAYESAEYKAT